jgi:hypothetical protein
VPVAELLRKHGLSRGTYFKWKAKYGGTSVPEPASTAFAAFRSAMTSTLPEPIADHIDDHW